MGNHMSNREVTLVNGVFEAHQRFSPVGPLYVASVLEKQGYQVDFREYQLNDLKNPFDVGNFLSFLDNSCDITGISCYSDFLPIVLLAVEKLKQAQPEKIIILGGEGPSGVAEEILEHFPFVDMIVKGEGERTIVELMQCLEAGGDLGLVKGISFRRGSQVYVSPARELVADLDTIPFPAHDKLNFAGYQMVGMTSSRGCPFRCTFCDVAPFWGHRFRARSVENIIEEIKLLKYEYGQNAITFYDELFTFNRKRVLEFCRKLKEENLNIQWSCLARIDSMDETLMQGMAENGCNMVSYGVESGSNKVQQAMRKRLTREKIKEMISLSLKYFEYIQTFFVWGFPFETMADFQETMDLIACVSELGTYPTVGYLAPFPFSRLYQENKEGLRFSRKIYLDSHANTDTEVVDLIERYPTVFPGFYVWESSLMEEKYEVAKQLGLNTPFLP